MTAEKPHSQDVLNDLRDLWWNADQIDLFARRLELASVTSLADIGCGHGHWGRMWQPRLAPGATIIGLDREPRWVARTPYPAVIGDATALPFADASFDAATCQTVLMHLADPAAAIAEMVRIVKPGGLVFCAEPVNFYNVVRFDDATPDRSVEDLAAVTAFWMRILRGKKALGEGDSLIGDQLPSLLSRAGLAEVRAWQSDRATPMIAPYDPVARAILDMSAENRRSGKNSWDEPLMRRRHAAGGGDDEAFARTMALLASWADGVEARVASGTYSTAGAGVHILAAGRKA
jgi:SAM-dependent methyltransferase